MTRPGVHQANNLQPFNPDQEPNLLDSLEATGLRVFVIDEDTDWSKMPTLKQLFGEE